LPDLVSTLSSRFQHLHDAVADKQTKLDLHAALRGAARRRQPTGPGRV
jgi:hypothetical protein